MFQRPKPITALLAAIHIIFFLSLLFPPWTSSPPKKKKLLVNTRISTPAAPAPAPAPKMSVAAASTKPKPTPPASKPVAKTPLSPRKQPAIADKKIAAAPQKKAPPAPTDRAKISDALLKQLQENISQMDAKKTKPHAYSPPAPAALFSLQIDAPGEGSEKDYTETLICTLHQTLSLPEFGEVKIQLTLREDGTAAKIIVLNTQSALNKKYLEAQLPKIHFPPFSGAFAPKKEHVFVLTFCNE